MLTPPSDVGASELFLKLLEPEPSEVIDFPRKGPDGKPIAQIRIRVLGMEFHDQARIKAFKFFKEKGYSGDDLQNISMREVVGDQIAKELIAMACLTAKEQGLSGNDGTPIYGRIFRDASEVDKLRPDELTVLFNAYKLVQDKYGPLEHNTDVERWVKRLAEGGETLPLLSLDLPELATLASSLAGKVYGIFRVLASQWEELPPTLASRLGKFSSDMSFYSGLPGTYEELIMDSRNDVIELEDAVALARTMKAHDRLQDDLAADD